MIDDHEKELYVMINKSKTKLICNLILQALPRLERQ